MSAVNKPKPTWRQVFDSAERMIGEPLEGVATSTRFVDVMAAGMKARRAVSGTAGWLVGGALTKVLHAVNIATLSDVQRVNGHVAELASELRTVPSPKASTRPRVVAAAEKDTTKKSATRPPARKAGSGAPNAKSASPDRAPREVDRDD